MIKKAINCINPNIIEIYKQSATLDNIHTEISALLPKHLQNEIKVNSFNKGILVLTSLNPMAGTELRYLLPELRDNLRKNKKFCQLINIQLKA